MSTSVAMLSRKDAWTVAKSPNRSSGKRKCKLKETSLERKSITRATWKLADSHRNISSAMLRHFVLLELKIQ